MNRIDTLARWRALLPEGAEWRGALRAVRRRPLAAATIVLALSTGIALAGAAFTFFSAVAGGELPYPDGERFVRLRAYDAEGARSGVEPERYRLLRDPAAGFAYLGAVRPGRFNLRLPGGDIAEVAGAELTPGWFRHLPAVPLAGRPLVDADGVAGAPPAVLLRESLWRRLLAADPAAIGASLDVAGVERTVVGVLPDGFGFPAAGELWLAMPELASGAGAVELAGVLAPGATIEAAGAAAAARSRRFDEARGAAARPLTLVTTRLTDLSGGGIESALALFVAMLCLVLLLIAANVANLIFAGAASRAGELALRAALGASRARLVRQLFAEVLLLGGVAAALGLAGSQLLLRWISSSMESGELPFWIDLSPDPASVLFIAVAAVAAAAVAGVAPALRATRELGATMKSAGARAGDRLSRVSGVALVAELALAVALVASAVAIARGVALAAKAGGGLPREAIATAQISFEGTDAEIAAKRAAILDAVGRLPGVAAAGATSSLPYRSAPLARIGLAPAAGEPAEPARLAPVAGVTAGFLEALAARPLAGRLLRAEDFAPGAAPVAVVNQPFVERHLGGRSPLGRRLRFEGSDGAVEREIVGVVPDLALSVGDPAYAGGVYVPIEAPGLFFLAVRGDAAASALLGPLRRTLYDLDPALTVRRVQPLAAVGGEDRSAMAAMSGVLTAIGAIALLLALVGVYALVSLRVTRRTREIGVRMALGARPGQIARLVLGNVGLLFALGALAGSALAAAFLAARSSILVERFPGPGPWLVPAVVALLAGAAAAACAAPLGRALAVDPARSLAAE